MKIGELFIALGFKIEGGAKLDETEKGIKRAAVESAKLTVAVNAINFALLAMMETAGRAGRALSNFVKETGLDPEELQRWQHLGAITGASADKVTAAFENLSKARASFALGEPSNVGVWQILGVDPRQDPGKVLAQLRDSVKRFDPAIAHELISRLGLGELTPLLRASDAEFQKWSRNFIISRDQIERLAKFNAAWESLNMSASQVKNLFAAALAPALTVVAKILEWGASKLAAFVDWLNKGSVVATVVRWAIAAVVIALLALGVTLAVVTAALGALTVAMIAFDVAAWASGIPEVILAITAAIAAVVGIVAALVLIVDDIITSLTGGKAVTRSIGEWAAGFKVVALAISAVWWIWDKLVAGVTGGFRVIKENARSLAISLSTGGIVSPGLVVGVSAIVRHWGQIVTKAREFGEKVRNFFTLATWLRVVIGVLHGVRWALAFVRDAWVSFVGSVASATDAILHPFRTLSALWDRIVDKARLVRDVLRLFPAFLFPGSPMMAPDRVADEATEPARRAGSTTNIEQENHLHVAIDGSDSPRETGRAVTKTFKDEIAGAAYQMPVPNY